MKGYVKNVSPIWTHAMKRAIGPGATVPLSELYKQYGKKHNLKKGAEFVEWLRTVKLTDVNRWKVVVEGDKTEAEESKSIVAPESDKAPKQMGIEDIIGLSVRRAREVLPKIMDLKLLKYALDEAGPRAGKDSLCRLLRKRIQELQISSR
jgi:hypothetical protein